LISNKKGEIMTDFFELTKAKIAHAQKFIEECKALGLTHCRIGDLEFCFVAEPMSPPVHEDIQEPKKQDMRDPQQIILDELFNDGMAN